MDRSIIYLSNMSYLDRHIQLCEKYEFPFNYGALSQLPLDIIERCAKSATLLHIVAHYGYPDKTTTVSDTDDLLSRLKFYSRHELTSHNLPNLLTLGYSKPKQGLFVDLAEIVLLDITTSTIYYPDTYKMKAMPIYNIKDITLYTPIS